MGLLLGELVGGEFVGWPEPDSFGRNRNPPGIRRNPEESRGIQRNPEESGGDTGIPVPQEFLQNIPVKVAEKKEFSRPLQNHVSVKKFLQEKEKTKKRVLRNPVFFCFSVQKLNSCQTGITNLEVVQCLLAYYEVIHWCLVSQAILYNIRPKADLLAGQVLYKSDFNVTGLICDEGTVGSAPRLRDNPLCNGNVLTGPFLSKTGGPHVTQSQAGP